MKNTTFLLLMFSGFFMAQTLNLPNDIYYCDKDNNGMEIIDLTQLESQITNDNSTTFEYYDSIGNTISNPTNYLVTSNTEISIVAQVNPGPGNPFEALVKIMQITCSGNEDNDGVANSFEDLNNDNNFNNDDTDADKIANFKDNDDDGDGILTINEDYNGNGNLMDDDTNTNGIPDYLDKQVALSNKEISKISDIGIYPNPAKDFVIISSKENVSKIELYSFSGSKLRTFSIEKINVSNLEKGVYILKIFTDKKNYNKQFIKQ